MTVYSTFQSACKNKALKTLRDFYSLLLNLFLAHLKTWKWVLKLHLFDPCLKKNKAYLKNDEETRKKESACLGNSKISLSYFSINVFII